MRASPTGVVSSSRGFVSGDLYDEGGIIRAYQMGFGHLR